MKKATCHAELLLAHNERPDELPIDLAIDRDPRVVRAQRLVFRLLQRLPGTHGRTFIAYSDARSELEVLRARVTGDLFFERGRLAGHVEAKHSSRVTRRLATSLIEMALAADVERPVAVDALLASARALVAGAQRGRKATRA